MQLVVCGVQVQRDAQGRYRLNDLHLASGGESRTRPNYWLENQQTQNLIIELGTDVEIAGIPAIESKQGLGTFVCRELVYAYAMWISPKFHLKVIRAYDALMMGADTLRPVDLLSEELKAAEILSVPLHYAQIEAVKVVADQTGRDYSNLLKHAPAQSNIPATEVMLEPTELGAHLGISAVRMNRFLETEGYQAKVSGQWKPTSKGEPYCSVHSWKVGSKSGYNLKWNLKILHVLGETEN